MSKFLPQTPGAVLKTPMAEYQLNPIKMANDIGPSQAGFRQIVIGMTKATIPAALCLARHFGATPNQGQRINRHPQRHTQSQKTTTMLRHYGGTQFW